MVELIGACFSGMGLSGVGFEEVRINGMCIWRVGINVGWLHKKKGYRRLV